VFVHACPQLQWEAPHCRAPRYPTGRIRIGIASAYLRSHSIGKTTRGLIAQLPRERYEIFTIGLPSKRTDEDELSRWMRERSEHWIALDYTLSAARAQLADLRLDVLFWQDIGMTPLSYYLAFARLAPVQCVSFGHPDTTGIPNMDYFVSNDLFEPADPSAHYSERLFLLHDLPTLAYYYRPTWAAGATRSAFGLGEDEHLYLCAQTLFKLHPDFDALLAQILRRDPRGRVILLRGHSSDAWIRQLRERFERHLPDVARRIHFIDRLGQQRFLQLLDLADVALDTLHFNGMNSSLEAFAVGTPVVTLPSGLQRGRHTQAMYRKMGLSECIASDAAQYAERAVEIATRPGYRHELKQRILERNAVLFEDPRVISEFDRFFESALRART
jgi:predicted O-linked N-acetylglucosamine transferase (SPINDLY family)